MIPVFKAEPLTVEIKGKTYTGGLKILVFKSVLGDCSNGGVSGKYSTLLLVGENIPAVDKIENPDNVVFIEIKNLRDGDDYLYLKPYCLKDRSGMASGSFGYSADSRFAEISLYPLPLHDRVES